MTRITGEVVIDAPLGEVFDAVADGRNEPRYNSRIVRAVKVDGGPVRAGSRFRAEPRGMGARGEMTTTVVEYDRPRRLRTEVRSSVMDVEGTLRLDEVDGGTRLRWDWDVALVGWLRLLSPVLAAVGPRWERRNWLGLKRYLEASRH